MSQQITVMSRQIRHRADQDRAERIASSLSVPAGRLLLAGVFAVVEVMLVVETALMPLARLRRM